MFGMKRLLPIVVLLFSLSAAGVYVWKSSQKKTEIPAVKESVVDKDLNDFGQPEIVVTDEEVRATRDAMMSTSKSGIIMSEEDVRKMLEERKKAERDAPINPLMPEMPDVDDLAPSSKSPGRAISPAELRNQIESIQQQAQPK